MPRCPHWFPRVPEILAALDDWPATVLDRADIESLFNLRRSAAAEAMRLLGGRAHGKTTLIAKRDLVVALHAMSQTDRFGVEHLRRLRLEQKLEQDRAFTSARRIRIPAARDVRERVTHELPGGIHLGDGRLIVEYFGAEDLLAKLLELSMAAANDFPAFQSRAEAGGASSAA